MDEGAPGALSDWRQGDGASRVNEQRSEYDRTPVGCPLIRTWPTWSLPMESEPDGLALVPRLSGSEGGY
ncbi:hypothetical protein NDU88_007103 [Pleurodeles waltl]|uniref:Uncharacterized protein n=1 Tax=Pleurodeles waltl TaxID=8319 RepID=A0AAV7SRU4_PLEWA|nr:hypothetical protein NDU88_007103 [Pleurodeles waltl]